MSALHHPPCPLCVEARVPVEPFPEEWKGVIGWEELYEVSTFGRVRSLDREVACEGHPNYESRFYPGKVLADYMAGCKRGYRYISLSRGKLRLRIAIGRLVWESHVDLIPLDHWLHYKDFDGSNPRLDNLEILPIREVIQLRNDHQKWKKQPALHTTHASYGP